MAEEIEEGVLQREAGLLAYLTNQEHRFGKDWLSAIKGRDVK